VIVLAEQLVAIDPGHGGHDPGAVSAGAQEKDIALAVSWKIAYVLDYWPGYKPFLTREEDSFVTLQKRAGLANTAEAALFVSVHTNAFSNPEANGTETFYFPGSQEGKRAAGLIQDELLSGLQLRDRGIKRARFAVLARTLMPAVLVELGFLTAEGKPELMQTDHFQWLSAVGICHGIRKYFEEG